MAPRQIWPSRSLIVIIVLLTIFAVGCDNEEPPASASIEPSEMADPTAEPDQGLVVELLNGKFSADQIEEG